MRLLQPIDKFNLEKSTLMEHFLKTENSLSSLSRVFIFHGKLGIMLAISFLECFGMKSVQEELKLDITVLKSH